MTLLAYTVRSEIGKKVLLSQVHMLEGLINLMTVLFVIGKFYKGLMFTKLLFDQLPLFNPYNWPLSVIRVLAQPWFNFWRRVLPPARIGNHSFEISSLIAFEAFDIVLHCVSYLKLILFIRLNSTLSKLS